MSYNQISESQERKKFSFVRSVVTVVFVSCVLLFGCLLLASCNVCIAGGNNECQQSSSTPQPPSPATQTTASTNASLTTVVSNSQPTPISSSCPTDSNDAAHKYGGNAGSWKQLARGEWFYQNANQPLQNATFKNTIHVDWWDNFNAHNGGPGDVTVPFASQLTLYCNPG